MSTQNPASVRAPERLTFPPGVIPDPMSMTSASMYDGRPYCPAIDHESPLGTMCQRWKGHTGRHLISDGQWVRIVWGDR